MSILLIAEHVTSARGKTRHHISKDTITGINKLGIGTTIPLQTLDVNGDISVRGGDFHSNGNHIISNSADATKLLIGAADASDDTQEIHLYSPYAMQ